MTLRGSNQLSNLASGGGSPSGELDRTDRRILSALVEDGRLSWSDLAEQVGLSTTPTQRRVRRLEAEGYIVGYGARLGERRLGGGISVYVSVTLANQAEETLGAFEHRIAELPEVMSCFLMTGNADYMLRVIVPSLDAYQDFLMNSLTRIAGISHIQSSFALREVIQRPSPPLKA